MGTFFWPNRCGERVSSILSSASSNGIDILCRTVVHSALVRFVLEGGKAPPSTSPALIRHQTCAAKRVVDGVLLGAGLKHARNFRLEIRRLVRVDLEPSPAKEALLLVLNETKRDDDAIERSDLKHAEQAFVLRFDVGPRAHPDLILEVRESLSNAFVFPFLAQDLHQATPMALATPCGGMHFRALLHMRTTALVLLLLRWAVPVFI
mmetsp:Transcript_2338/g.5445  ORF Transcript_2338/g.5445 Transcript_2338/m.5445 type:complete len:207 (+) Transcript_2338:520-1140(+)